MMPITLFVVDDSPTVMMSLCSQLADAGYSVEAAIDGRQALDRLQAGLKPDLILTDINMPHMDGLTLIREIRGFRPTRFIPILVLTTETGMETEARSAGASGWLAKPWDRETLLTTIERLLPGKGKS